MGSPTASTPWWMALWTALPLSAYVSLLGAAPYALLERLVLWPLELYESLAILPVSYLRRHMPLLGGTLVVLMTLHGILLRLFLDMVHAIFARVTYSRDPVLNFRTFWIAMRDRYAFLALRHVDWPFVHQLYGDAMQSSTSDDDLWIALQESLSLCNDPSLSLSPSSAGADAATARGKKLSDATTRAAQHAALARIEQRHLTDGGRRIANHFVCGILNAETSPGWRIGYLSLASMTGFVDFPMPRVDALVPGWSGASADADATDLLATATALNSAASKVTVPEIYDLESMRWALDAILKSLGDLDGLILDLRFNQGGGSLRSALAVASSFAGPKRSPAFAIDERVPGADVHRFGKRKTYSIPTSSRAVRYSGPLVVLQSHYTRGYVLASRSIAMSSAVAIAEAIMLTLPPVRAARTAELLCLALRNRLQTCSVGTRTAGSLSSTHTLRLPNCWAVEIPHQRCFSADGELFEGVGIPPTRDVAGAGLADSSSKVDTCIKRALEHIMNV